MPMDTDRNHMESADENCPVCNIEPALVRGGESSPEQLCVKGMEEYDNGQLIKAMQYYMTALSLNPSFIPALLGATCVLVAMERYQEAQSYLDYVFELDPDIKDAKLLRNIINNAKTGYPVFDGEKAVDEPAVPASDVDDEAEQNEYADEEITEKTGFQKAKPYLLAFIIVVLCYLAVNPYFKDQKPEAAKLDITSIRHSLAAEPALKDQEIKAEIKGEEIILSGKVANQAERRLAIVITEQAGKPLKIDAAKLQIGEGTPAVKPETKPQSKPQVNTKNNKKNYYTVKQGDTLSLIARNKYGNGIYWRKIQGANPKLLRNQDDLQPGMVIILPD